MKKFTSLFLLLALTLASAFAEAGAANNRYTHSYDFRDFTALSVSHAFLVDLNFTDSYEVSIDVPDFIEPYLKIAQNDGKVRIDLEKLPNDVQRRLNDEKVPLLARVSVPKLTKLELSGASKLNASGRLVLGDEDLDIDMNGAAELNGLVAQGRKELSIELNGASKADFEATFSELDVELSGAAKLRFGGNAQKLEIELAGASSAQFDGNYDETVAHVSGSSKFTLSRNCSQLSIEQSGATKFECMGKVARASVELSGAAKAKFVVSDKLHYSLSGVSTLRVKKDGNPKVSGEASRGSKVEWFK